MEPEKNNPDDIGRRKELYIYYISKLINILSIKYGKTGFSEEQIKMDILSIINYASNGSTSKRLDGVLAFECEYYKNKNANNYTFTIPIKYNPTNRDLDEKTFGDDNAELEKMAKEQVDILITYLANRMIIDKITWKPIDRPGSILDRNNYPKLQYVPELIHGNFYIETLVTNNKRSIQIKVLRK